MQSLASSKKQSWLSWFMRGLIILSFLILFGRLADLQIIRGEYYRNIAEGNRIRRVVIPAARGKILARGGEPLASNKEIKQRIVFNKDTGYQLTDDITDVSENDLISGWLRDYKLASGASHITGYVGFVTDKELGKVRPECIEKGPLKSVSMTGKTGLEYQYDCVLSGIDGEELVEVDASGKKIRVLGTRDPLSGENLQTTINYNLQKKVSEVMSESKGSIIITSPKGEVLALYSNPSYDPNVLIRGRSEKIDEIFTNKDFPLFNRVISGTYHPGSIYKSLISLAALQEGAIDSSFTFEDTGQIVIESPYGNYSYRNWYFTQYGGVEGEIGLERALARSTDTYFYKMGELLGIDKIAEWSRDFGLDSKTGIDLPGEVEGLVPDREWKERVKGERWFLGNTYHVSIGQGDLAVTPIGIHRALSLFANHGEMCTPFLVGSPRCTSIGASQKHIDQIIDGMQEVCSTGGTAYPFFDFPRRNSDESAVACKTGTAQTNNTEDTHAWFTAFAPVDNPEIVATILVERGGEGSKVAAPLMREIFDYWFGYASIEESKNSSESATLFE